MDKNDSFGTVLMNNALEHHGILGMKWGVRRYQNKDGSLTAAGKKHQQESNSDNDFQETEQSKITSSRKSVKSMTDEELQTAINRLSNEKKYRELLSEESKSQISAGKKYASEILAQIGKNTLVNLGTQVANHVIGNAINKFAKVASDDVNKRVVNPQKGQSDKK